MADPIVDRQLIEDFRRNKEQTAEVPFMPSFPKLEEIDGYIAEERNRIAKNTKDDNCFIKAKARGQRTFTLVEQDMLSPAVIGEWIKLALINGTSAEKIHQAVDDAIAMRDSKIGKKMPD
jgi:hypothetical protein